MGRRKTLDGVRGAGSAGVGARRGSRKECGEWGVGEGRGVFFFGRKRTKKPYKKVLSYWFLKAVCDKLESRFQKTALCGDFGIFKVSFPSLCAPLRRVVAGLHALL